MTFFDENPMHLPADAKYFFDVAVICIAVRESLGGEYEDIWDLEGILEPRPYVIHFYKDCDELFQPQNNWEMDIYHHCVVEVSDSLGVSFYSTYDSDEEYDGEFVDPDDFWRF